MLINAPGETLRSSAEMNFYFGWWLLYPISQMYFFCLLSKLLKNLYYYTFSHVFLLIGTPESVSMQLVVTDC